MNQVQDIFNIAMSHQQFVLSIDQLLVLKDQIKFLYNNKIAFQEITGSVIIIGDLHGMLQDLQQYLIDFKDKKLVFLGDYLDRGPYGYETFILVLSRQLLYPQLTVMMRGNHETKEMSLNQKSQSQSLYQEICYKYSREQQGLVIEIFAEIFNYLPLFTLINQSYLCIHGCLPPFLEDFNDLKEIKLPCYISEYMSNICLLEFNCLWTDPLSTVEYNQQMALSECLYKGKSLELKLNGRRNETGVVTTFQKVTEQLDSFGLKALFRGHEPQDGIGISYNGRIYTLQGHQFNKTQQVGSCCIEVSSQNELNFYYY